MFRSPLRILLTILTCTILTGAVVAGELPAYKPDANAARSEVPDAYKWDLSPLFESPDAWEKEMVALRKEMAGLTAFQGQLTEPMALKKCLDLYFGLHDRASRVTQYANLAVDSEQTNQELQARSQRGLEGIYRSTDN